MGARDGWRKRTNPPVLPQPWTGRTTERSRMPVLHSGPPWSKLRGAPTSPPHSALAGGTVLVPLPGLGQAYVGQRWPAAVPALPMLVIAAAVVATRSGRRRAQRLLSSELPGRGHRGEHRALRLASLRDRACRPVAARRDPAERASRDRRSSSSWRPAWPCTPGSGSSRSSTTARSAGLRRALAEFRAAPDPVRATPDRARARQPARSTAGTAPSGSTSCSWAPTRIRPRRGAHRRHPGRQR